MEIFEARCLELCKDDEFKKTFQGLSRVGDKNGMIDKLFCSKEIRDFFVVDEYQEKNEKEARDLLEKFSELDTEEQKTEKTCSTILNQALLKAPFKSPVFFDVLRRRSHAWYLIGNLIRCIKDCELLNDWIDATNDRGDLSDEFKIESLLLRSECYKLVDNISESKNLLNEAMKSINDLACKHYPGRHVATDEVRAEKTKLFREFFTTINHLNEAQDKEHYYFVKVDVSYSLFFSVS